MGIELGKGFLALPYQKGEKRARENMRVNS